MVSRGETKEWEGREALSGSAGKVLPSRLNPLEFQTLKPLVRKRGLIPAAVL